MKLWRKVQTPKTQRIEFCDPCGTVSTESERAQRMRERVRDHAVARTLRHV